MVVRASLRDEERKKLGQDVDKALSSIIRMRLTGGEGKKLEFARFVRLDNILEDDVSLAKLLDVFGDIIGSSDFDRWLETEKGKKLGGAANLLSGLTKNAKLPSGIAGIYLQALRHLLFEFLKDTYGGTLEFFEKTGHSVNKLFRKLFSDEELPEFYAWLFVEYMKKRGIPSESYAKTLASIVAQKLSHVLGKGREWEKRFVETVEHLLEGGRLKASWDIMKKRAEILLWPF